MKIPNDIIFVEIQNYIVRDFYGITTKKGKKKSKHK